MAKLIAAKSDDQFLWVDLMKAVALLWIFLNHTSEKLFGSPCFANPDPQWPPLAERIHQLTPIAGHGYWDLFLNFIRWIGWSGDQGVQLFLMVSGFGLAWGFLKKNVPDRLDPLWFYRRRLLRILPLWWAVHFLALSVAVMLGSPGLDDYRFYLSFIGIRATPELLYYIQPGWWYIGLLQQLYIVFPWLWYVLRKKNTVTFTVFFILIPLFIRLLGLLFFHEYLDAWSRGALFITRLPEFALGMLLATRLHSAPSAGLKQLVSNRTWAAAAATYALGFILSFSLAGMALSTVLLGTGAFLILLKPLNWFGSIASPLRVPLFWIGRHSYSLFLLHGFFVKFLVPSDYSVAPLKLVGQVTLALFLTVVSGFILDWIVDRVVSILKDVASRRGTGRAMAYCAGFVFFCFGSLMAGETLVRTYSPQEVFGWGERPSLEPHDRFGWRLIPNKTTRLRWETYDYLMKANSLGFPGPEFAAHKSQDCFRIFVTGDAFTSAEGVDTGLSWPRLLEHRLALKDSGRKVEVLNFAITGYGPLQEQSVVDSFVPIYRPDLIIIEMFVNDFQDVLTSNDGFQESIGFGRLSPESASSHLRFAHLSRFLKDKLIEPAIASVRSRPSPPYGYFLGNFAALEFKRTDIVRDGRGRVRASLEQIQKVANKWGAEVLLLMVPAPVQVCQSKNLTYYPHNVDLRDTTTFDLDLPQRMALEIADSLGIEFVDLRQVFVPQSGLCLYQASNMHWTREGHASVAEFLAKFLAGKMPREKRSAMELH
jgi:peptidoglycan/LPS O-acetylase OafA/YrhL/lysophospholipase L1-like esterase